MSWPPFTELGACLDQTISALNKPGLTAASPPTRTKERYCLARPVCPVNAIAPALIEGGTTLPGREEEHRQLATRIPIGRLGRPEEVADAVQLLISNAFLTSQTIVIDGGLYPR